MVRILSRVALSTALLALLAVPATAQDVSGDWDFTFEAGPQGPQTITVTLTQEGASVSGTAMLPMLQGVSVEVSDGMLEGDKLTFAFHIDANGQTFSLSFSATVDGNAMEP